MKKLISIIIGKSILLVGRLVHRGSSLPGGIALKVNSNLIAQIKKPDIVIAVTGSSGKGSITTMITSILRDSGYKVAHNSAGSNLSAGITTLMLENCSLTGKLKCNAIVAEVDERYAKYVFPQLKPNYVVISNITRDQPPRQGHFDLVLKEIKKAITPDMHLILNSDDPMLQKFVLNNENKITYYGIDKNKYSYVINKFQNLNLEHCPICHTKLTYDYYHFEENGMYHCSNCSFKRPIPNESCTSINYDNSTITINNKYKTHIPYKVLYCVYNTLASFTLTKQIGLDTDKIVNSINNLASSNKNISSYKYNDRIVEVLNTKNENSTTFNQALLYVDRAKCLKTIVIGWKEISRRYNFDDLSWLYDIDFELLAKHDIDSIVCVGIHRYDIATRIKYSSIEESKIITFENLNEASLYIKEKTKGNIYAILNFDYVVPFNDLMIGSDK